MNGTHGRELFLAGVFLACMCGLMLQIMQTRILSIISYYHMAFFTIGMAMLGMTLGALLVYYDKIPFLRAGLAVTLAKVMTAFACSVVISLVLLLSISLSSRFEPSLRFVTVWVLAIGVLSPPYVFLGMAISLALTRSPYAISQVYGFDLLGAAIGCLVTLGLLTFTDTYTAVMLVGAVGAGSAWLFQQVSRTSDGNSVTEKSGFASSVLLNPASSSEPLCPP